MTVLKFRVVLDTKNDVFRDIEILSDQTFEEFHVAILKAFDFTGDKMASFYMSDEEWSKGQEITLVDMGEPGQENGPLLMEKTTLDDMIVEENEKIVYVYDFLVMWCFYVELVDEFKSNPERSYPRVSMKFGDAPREDSKLEPDSMMGMEDDEDEEDRDEEMDEEMFSDMDEEYEESSE